MLLRLDYSFLQIYISMKTRLLLIFVLIGFSSLLSGQTVITAEKGTITFFSEAPLEDIKAENRDVKAALNIDNGEILVRLFIRDFSFRKARMQEHFNEKYMNSANYPKSAFEGKILDFTYEEIKETDAFPIKGKLTIKGENRDIQTSTIVSQRDDQLVFEAEFPVKLEDYDVKIPRIMMKNIAEIVEVKVRLVFPRP